MSVNCYSQLEEHDVPPISSLVRWAKTNTINRNSENENTAGIEKDRGKNDPVDFSVGFRCTYWNQQDETETKKSEMEKKNSFTHRNECVLYSIYSDTLLP